MQEREAEVGYLRQSLGVGEEEGAARNRSVTGEIGDSQSGIVVGD